LCFASRTLRILFGTFAVHAFCLSGKNGNHEVRKGFAKDARKEEQLLLEVIADGFCLGAGHHRRQRGRVSLFD
jgi:hypothetical protein